MRKRPPEALATEATLYVGLGPGFEAPQNCNAVIETVRGHTLGRVIWTGRSLDDTKAPEGDARRVLRAPRRGIFQSDARIGDHFEEGQQIATVGDQPIVAPFAGILRGLLRPGIAAAEGMKVGDLDSRDDPRLCELVSDKSLAVGGGVLEAALALPQVRARLWT
jgi:xanthine dehydrogenase accessory factor